MECTCGTSFFERHFGNRQSFCGATIGVAMTNSTRDANMHACWREHPRYVFVLNDVRLDATKNRHARALRFGVTRARSYATYPGPCRTWIRPWRYPGRNLRGVPSGRVPGVPKQLFCVQKVRPLKVVPAESCRRVSCTVLSGCVTIEQSVRRAMPPCLAVATRAPNVQIYQKKNAP